MARAKHEPGQRARYHGDPIPCARCGQDFMPDRVDRRYCSAACSNRAAARRRTGGHRRIRVRYYFRLCRVCGALTEARSGPRVYCSDDCYRQYLHDRHVASYVSVEPHETTCKRCGAVFVAKWRRVCDRCVEMARRAAAKRGNRRRRARLRIASVPYHDEDIFERDGWRCHICHRKVRRDKAGAGYHPLQPTIDHIIPLADGGADAPVNVATAHNICNSVKGASGPGQLRLLA